METRSPSPSGAQASTPEASTHDPAAWRDRFPILESTTYLVNHSLGAMPKAVFGKLQAYAEQWAQRGVRAWAEGWWTAPVDVGNLVGRIMNAPEGTVVMHQNVSVIESIIASSLDFSGPRNKVVYTDQGASERVRSAATTPGGVATPVELAAAFVKANEHKLGELDPGELVAYAREVLS